MLPIYPYQTLLRFSYLEEINGRHGTDGEADRQGATLNAPSLPWKAA